MAPIGRKASMMPATEVAMSTATLQSLNRAGLQKMCKRFNLKANGKNTDLLERLTEHFKRNGGHDGSAPQPEKEDPPPATPQPTKSRTETDGHGWCVVHGMELRLRPSNWVLLVLRGGRSCVVDGEKVSPFLLAPASSAVPPHLDDNYICAECALLNQEKYTWVQQRSSVSDSAATPVPRIRLPPKSDPSTSKKRVRNHSGKYYPQENPDYARRVDEMLSKMAVGELDYANVLCPSKPAVVHSPVPKNLAMGDLV